MKQLSLILAAAAAAFLTSCGDPDPFVPVIGATKSGATASAPTGPAPTAPAPTPAPAMAVSAPAPKAAPAAAPAPAPAPAPAAVASTVTKPSGATKKIKPEFPAAEFAGTPLPADNTIPNLDKTGKPITEVDVAEGVEVISKGKKVTSSDANPFTGSLDLVTDGEKSGGDGFFVELAPATQWIQIDLGAEKEVHGLWVWHFHKQAVVYKGVVVGVSNDPEFKSPTYIFNNDFDGSVAQGIGKDLSYTETQHGRWMPAKDGPVKGRYVRLYSNGRYMDEMNHYVEVEVYGK